MAKFSAATDHALDVIAHVAMAGNLSGKVEGMERFQEHYLKQLSAGDKAIYQRFKALHQKARGDLARLMEQELKADGQ